MEIMVALLVFGVGSVAVASLWPAAIICRERSVNDGVGSMICANGLSLLKAHGQAADVPDVLGPIVAEDDTDMLEPEEQNWPVRAEANESGMGLAALGQRLTDAGACRLIVVAYHKREGGQVRWDNVIVESAAGLRKEIELPDGHPVRKGTPVIFRQTGRYAYVLRVYDDGGQQTALLNRELDVPNGNKTAYVLVEVDGGDIASVSPAMRVLSARAELEP